MSRAREYSLSQASLRFPEPPLSARSRIRIVPLAYTLALLPLCFLGYGSDNDTYTVLDSGVSTWHLHLPETSRNPGYWLFEAIVYWLRHLGGSLATNISTVVVATFLLWRFLRVADRFGVRFPLLMAASLAVTPVFLIASTSTVDYLWSLLGIVLFVEFLLDQRYAPAILCAAFAFAIRPANGALVAGALFGAIAATPRTAIRLASVGLAAAALGGLPLVESYRLANHTFAFTHALAGSDAMWSANMRVGRFLYKSFYLFGPLASAVLTVALLWRGGRVLQTKSDYSRRAIPVVLGIIAANATLFLVYPIEISYLIPAAFFLMLLAGMRVEQKAAAVATLLAILSLNFITPQFAEPNLAGHATAASFRPSVSPGVLVEDIRLRYALCDCEDYRCYYLRFHPNSHDLDPFPSK